LELTVEELVIEVQLHTTLLISGRSLRDTAPDDN
jgi:hypothetical protein